MCCVNVLGIKYVNPLGADHDNAKLSHIDWYDDPPLLFIWYHLRLFQKKRFSQAVWEACGGTTAGQFRFILSFFLIPPSHNSPHYTRHHRHCCFPALFHDQSPGAHWQSIVVLDYYWQSHLFV